MERDFLDLIKKAESEAEEKINSARIRSAEIEREGTGSAQALISGVRDDWQKRKEQELSDAQYNIKKKYDNKKTFLTVALDEMKLKASGNIDRAAGSIVERILNS